MYSNHLNTSILHIAVDVTFHDGIFEEYDQSVFETKFL